MGNDRLFSMGSYFADLTVFHWKFLKVSHHRCTRVLENNVLGAYNCSYDLSKCTE